MEIEKELPKSLAAECSLLGAAILNPATVLAVLSEVREAQFADHRNRLIFRAMQLLTARGIPVDLVTLTEELANSGDLERAGEAHYIASLPDGVPRIGNAPHYAGIIREKAKLRAVIKMADELQRRAFDDSGVSAEDLASGGVASLLDIAAGNDAAVTVRDWSQVAQSAMQEIERAYKDPSSVRAFKFGLSDLDEITSGLRPKEIVLIVAPTSNGKTLLASQLAMQSDRDGFKCLFFSAEMPAEQIALREIAYQAGVKFYYLRRPYSLDEAEMARLRDATKAKCGVRFVDRDITPTRIAAMAEAEKRTRDLDLVIVDYDQLVIEAGIPFSDEDNVFRHQRAFMLAAKKMAERLDVCFVLLSQLRKLPPKVQSGNANPHLDDIWGDSSVRNTPHVILWVSRDFFRHNMETEYERKATVYVLKSRNDRTAIVPLEFDPERVRFLDAPPSEKDSTPE